MSDTEKIDLFNPTVQLLENINSKLLKVQDVLLLDRPVQAYVLLCQVLDYIPELERRATANLIQKS